MFSLRNSTVRNRIRSNERAQISCHGLIEWTGVSLLPLLSSQRSWKKDKRDRHCHSPQVLRSCAHTFGHWGENVALNTPCMNSYRICQIDGNEFLFSFSLLSPSSFSHITCTLNFSRQELSVRASSVINIFAA